jgi:DNA-binding SARP family transcriptional activator
MPPRAQTSHTPRLEVRLLPAFELRYLGERQALPSGAQRVIAYTAVQQKPVSRHRLAVLLWPEADPCRSAASLRSTLWHVRRRAPGVLGSDGQAVWLSSSVEVDHAAALAAASQQPPDRQHEGLLSDLLTEWSEEWVLFERERFRQIRLHALEEVSRTLTSEGDTRSAIDVALRAVSADPLRETGQRALIEAHLADGNVSEAIRQYRFFDALLMAELGVCASRELSHLVATAAGTAPAGSGLGVR